MAGQRTKNPNKKSKAEPNLKGNNYSVSADAMIYTFEIFGVILLSVGAFVFGFYHHKIAGIWIVYSGVVVALAGLVVKLVDEVKHGDDEPTVRDESGAVALNKTAPFSVKYSWTQNSGDKPTIWFVKYGENTPIYCAMMVSFTNLRTTPILISSYVIEQKTNTEKWEIISIKTGPEEGFFYSGPDTTNVSEMDYTTFESAISNKNIAAGETVMGWMFTTKQPFLAGAEIRLRITDGVGEILTGEFKNQGGIGWPNQPRLIKSQGPRIDISAVPVVK